MLQFYFLSILLNVLAGLVLVYASDFTKKASSLTTDITPNEGESEEPSESDEETVSDEGDSEGSSRAEAMFKGAFLDDMTFRMVLGIISVLGGIMKLLSPVKDDIPVIGDLIPALAGIAAGAALLLEYYAVRNSLEEAFPVFIQRIFFEGRKYIGVFCIIAGLMHFIFPRVLFL
ncbi:MAG: hypothetical protein K6G80_04290 [Treponema sp.]|nr:hypothetical protein [Treponema sp.]